MTKKQLLWIVLGFICGVAVTLLCRFGFDRWQVYQRYQNCLGYDYSSIDLSDAVSVLDDEMGTRYHWQAITVQVQGDVTLIFDYATGQLREYHNGVLRQMLVEDYTEKALPQGKIYQVRSQEECDRISVLLEDENFDEIRQLDGRVWQFASGETFVD